MYKVEKVTIFCKIISSANLSPAVDARLLLTSHGLLMNFANAIAIEGTEEMFFAVAEMVKRKCFSLARVTLI